MAGLFERWRAFSDRIVGALVITCGILSILGGLQLWRSSGPPLAWGLFIGFGVTVLVFAFVRRPS
ncbi:MAG: hypothetical protein HONBIEJF_02899 [Fimbriimonadaceae bacterium]|nr:hypothetical protein [Fimbriimonadaceae bacterium]